MKLGSNLLLKWKYLAIHCSTVFLWLKNSLKKIWYFFRHSNIDNLVDTLQTLYWYPYPKVLLKMGSKQWFSLQRYYLSIISDNEEFQCSPLWPKFVPERKVPDRLNDDPQPAQGLAAINDLPDGWRAQFRGHCWTWMLASPRHWRGVQRYIHL